MSKDSLEHLQTAYDNLWKKHIEQENRVYHRDKVIGQMQENDQRNEPYVLLCAEELSLLPMAWSVRLGADFRLKTSEGGTILAYGWLISKSAVLESELFRELRNAKDCGLLGFMMPDKSGRYGCITDFLLGQRNFGGKDSKIPIVCEAMINLSCDDMARAGLIYPFVAKYAGSDLERAMRPDAFVKLMKVAGMLPKEIQDWRQYINFNLLSSFDYDSGERKRDRLRIAWGRRG